MTNLCFLVVFHNSEHSVRAILHQIRVSIGTDDSLLVVLDGCTDRTRRFAEKELSRLRAGQVELIETSDLHEIGSLRVGFSHAKNRKWDYLVHLQGDQILPSNSINAIRLELPKIEKVGLVSLRMGGHIERDAAGSLVLKMFETPWGHKGKNSRDIPSMLRQCQVAVRGPLIYSRRVLELAGFSVDEGLRDHSFDDVDLSLMGVLCGLKNYSWSIPFRSDLPWGVTRRSNRSDRRPVGLVAEKNWMYVIGKYAKSMDDLFWTNSARRTSLAPEYSAESHFIRRGRTVNGALLANPRAGIHHQSAYLFKVALVRLVSHIDLRLLRFFRA